jgi:SNF2 family DNA or RNA helicase
MLDGHRPNHEELAGLLGPSDHNRGCLEQWAAFAVDHRLGVTDLERYLFCQGQEQAQNLKELFDAKASADFFQRTVATLTQDGGSNEARSCSVCMEDDLPLDKLAITHCAHTFCMDCLRATVEKFSSCSICRRQLSNADVRPLAAEIQGHALEVNSSGSFASSSSSSTAPAPTQSISEAPLQYHKYGSKLAVLVQKLRELRALDPAAKVILFAQFDDLKRKVLTALSEFGIPCASLQGSVGQRASIIRDWQHNPMSQTFVLLLSLAQSASGTNLTAASHVVFLHPMLASSAEKAVGYEMQAIGRARRHGQQRGVVHVWRFVTFGTLEQVITEQHMGTLWEREQARQQQEQELRQQHQQQEEQMQQNQE